MRIKKLTQSIRDNSKHALCYGTLKALKTIDDQADELELRIEALKLENEKLSKLIPYSAASDD